MSHLQIIRNDPALTAANLLGGGGDWEDRALCQQVDPEIFYPDKGETDRLAKRICGGCDVRRECLEDALRRGEQHGVWGGMSEQERRTEIKRRAGQTEVAA